MYRYHRLEGNGIQRAGYRCNTDDVSNTVRWIRGETLIPQHSVITNGNHAYWAVPADYSSFLANKHLSKTSSNFRQAGLMG